MRGSESLAVVVSALLWSACTLTHEPQRYCRESTESGFCQPERIAIERLIAQAKEFHGRRVKVRGYAHVEVENSGLYPSRYDFEEWRSKRGLWLELTAHSADPVDRMVEVEGTFDRTNQGHLGNWSGAVTNIFRLKTLGDETP